MIKKKQKKDAKGGTLTPSGSMTNADSDDPFEEITRWFRTKRLDRVACPNPIPWWGVSVFLDEKTFNVLMFAFSTNSNIRFFD